MAAVAVAPAPTEQQRQQVPDPALTPEDTRALLAGAFPQVGDFDAFIGVGSGLLAFDGGMEQTYMDDSTKLSLPYGLPPIQTSVSSPAGPEAPQMLEAGGFCKAEPTTPAAGGGAWVPQPDWAAAYDSFMGPSPFGGCAYSDMGGQFGGGLDASSWSPDDGSFCLSPSGVSSGDADFSASAALQLPTVRTMPDMSALEQKPDIAESCGSDAEGDEGDDATMVPALSATPVSHNSGCTTLASTTLDMAGGGGEAMLAPMGMHPRRGGSGSGGGSPTASGASSDSACTPVSLSASAQCAADLMPAIGGGDGIAGAPQRRWRLGAKPSDAELKAAIAALQKSTTCGASASDEAYVTTRAECLDRYREKKLRRLDVNTIRYMKRKINADRRPRIKGRFVKAEELDAYKAGLLSGQNGCPPVC